MHALCTFEKLQNIYLVEKYSLLFREKNIFLQIIARSMFY